jgi:hypothetical protein
MDLDSGSTTRISSPDRHFGRSECMCESKLPRVSEEEDSTHQFRRRIFATANDKHARDDPQGSQHHFFCTTTHSNAININKGVSRA